MNAIELTARECSLLITAIGRLTNPSPYLAEEYLALVQKLSIAQREVR